VANFLDKDSDGDSISDDDEGLADSNHDGTADVVQSAVDGSIEHLKGGAIASNRGMSTWTGIGYVVAGTVFFTGLSLFTIKKMAGTKYSPLPMHDKYAH
jgi:hypothetical protein